MTQSVSNLSTCQNSCSPGSKRCSEKQARHRIPLHVECMHAWQRRCSHRIPEEDVCIEYPRSLHRIPVYVLREELSDRNDVEGWTDARDLTVSLTHSFSLSLSHTRIHPLSLAGAGTAQGVCVCVYVCVYVRVCVQAPRPCQERNREATAIQSPRWQSREQTTPRYRNCTHTSRV